MAFNIQQEKICLQVFGIRCFCRVKWMELNSYFECKMNSLVRLKLIISNELSSQKNKLFFWGLSSEVLFGIFLLNEQFESAKLNE